MYCALWNICSYWICTHTYIEFILLSIYNTLFIKTHLILLWLFFCSQPVLSTNVWPNWIVTCAHTDLKFHTAKFVQHIVHLVPDNGLRVFVLTLCCALRNICLYWLYMYVRILTLNFILLSLYNTLFIWFLIMAHVILFSLCAVLSMKHLNIYAYWPWISYC